MRLNVLIVFLLLAGAMCSRSYGQTIHGEVVDMDSKRPVNDVSILNIYTDLNISTDMDGHFIIAASSDQLLEFRKAGYKTVRVRVPKGYIPSYFKIIMQHGFVPVGEMLASNNRYNYRDDSIRFHDLYKHELDFEKLSAFGSIAHPFSALSKKNREIWRFQEEYSDFEKVKYVDRTFNAEVVTKFTGLTGDSLRTFMIKYRPSYEQLRGMNDYSYFTYIKKAVENYRNAWTPRNGQ